MSQCCSVGGGPAPPRASRCVRHRLQRGPRARGGRGRRGSRPRGREPGARPQPLRARGRGLGRSPGSLPPLQGEGCFSSSPTTCWLGAVTPESCPKRQGGWAFVRGTQASRRPPARSSHGTFQHPLGAGKGQARPGGAQPQVSVPLAAPPSGPVQVAWTGGALSAGRGAVTVAWKSAPAVPRRTNNAAEASAGPGLPSQEPELKCVKPTVPEPRNGSSGGPTAARDSSPEVSRMAVGTARWPSRPGNVQGPSPSPRKPCRPPRPSPRRAAAAAAAAAESPPRSARSGRAPAGAGPALRLRRWFASTRG